jgi:hypothetical protein
MSEKKKIRLVLDNGPILKANQRAYLLKNVIYGGGENTCKYCNKTYKSSAYLEKHTLLCKLMCDMASENMTILDDIPTPRSMYIMLLELANKYKGLEDKYDHLNKWVLKKKKKINLTEWLNDHVEKPVYVNYITYFDDKFEITLTDIDMLFNLNYNDFFNLILQKIDFNNSPVVGLSDKANIIYGFVEDKWCELTKIQLSSLFFRCKKTIFSKALELKTLKKDEIAKSDKLEAQFDRLMLKLINAEMSNGGLYNKLRFCLYNRIKKDIKNIVEYDLEF